MRIASFLLLLIYLKCSAQFQYRDLHINDGYNANETSVAINPTNPSEIVAASNIDNFYYSNDGGNQWKHIKSYSSLGIYGDPVLHYAGSQLYFAHLAKTPGKAYGDWFDRIIVQRIDSLTPWTERSYSVGYNGTKMQDKPWLSSNDSGTVYVTWTEFDKYESDNPGDHSRIRFSKIAPRDTAFSDAITISDLEGDCLDGDNTLEGATTAVGKNGEIYCVWSGMDQLFFDKSLDGGKTWSTDVVIAKHVKGWDMKIPNNFRANGMPFIATNNKDGSIYITWADEFLGNGDIWMLVSKDGGKTWSDRIKLNLDRGDSHQYLPNMSFNQELQTLEVVFYDQRHSSTGTFYDVYLAQYHAVSGVRNKRISQFSIPLPGSSFFYGDYIDVSSLGAKTVVVYPIYHDNQTSIACFVSNPPKSLMVVWSHNSIAVGLMQNENDYTLDLKASYPFKAKAKMKLGKPFHYQKIKAKKESKSGDSFEEALIKFSASSVSQKLILKYKIIDLEQGYKHRHKIVKIIPPKAD